MTTTTDRPQPRTAAALAARRRDTQAALERVHEAITRLRRDKTPLTVAAVAHRADVSRTFLYTNSDAKTAVAEAIRETAANETASKTSRATAVRRAGANVRSTPSTRSRPRTTRSSPSGHGSASCSAASATWKPNGPRTRSSASPPRTPHSSSVSASSPPTTAPWTNASTPPAPTCASKTGVSPTSKPALPTPAPPADQPDRHPPGSATTPRVLTPCQHREHVIYV